MTIPISKKHTLLNYEGVKFPCFPSAVEVKESLSKNIVESLQCNPMTQPIEYDKEAAEILNGDRIYIGMLSLFCSHSSHYNFTYYYVVTNLLGKETLHHLTTEARRRVGGQQTKTVTLTKRIVPTRELDLRFQFVKLCKKIVDR